MFEQRAEQVASSVKILCVEDDPVYFKFIKATLDSVPDTHFDLVWCPTLADAVQDDEHPDIILLDLMLPDCKGLATFQRMYEKTQDIPIIVISILADENLAVQAVQQGAQDFLLKSKISSDSLIRCIRYTLARIQVCQYRERLQAISDFTAALAHDLHTPLVGAGLVLDSMLEVSPAELPPSFAELLVTLRKCNQQVREKVRTLLEIYRLETEATEIKFESLDLSNLIGECIEDFSSLQSTENVKIVEHVQPKLMVRGNRELLVQLFANLFDNAFKHASRPVRIEVNCELRADQIVIEVKDDGPGIAEQDLPLLFKKFWRGSANKYSPGIGLGLYMCEQIVTKHMGGISVASKPGDGSTFTVSLRQDSE